MRRALVLLVLAASACAPPIVIPDDARVKKVERRAAEVELCVLYQEKWDRHLFEGVRELNFDTWHFAIASVVVKHPRGLTVIDPAFGRDVAREMRRMPLPLKLALGDGSKQTPLVNVMLNAGLEPLDVKLALATHAHWDHVGGLVDLPRAQVLLPKAEVAWVHTLQGYIPSGVMPHHLENVEARLATYDFDGPPVEGFEKSHDVFGDGSVVAVPMPGHTPGHVALLVRLAGGKTALFAGDASWTLRGVEAPVHKLAPLDSDLEKTGEALGVLNRFMKLRPDVLVVPAHDAAALGHLPTCGVPVSAEVQ